MQYPGQRGQIDVKFVSANLPGRRSLRAKVLSIYFYGRILTLAAQQNPIPPLNGSVPEPAEHPSDAFPKRFFMFKSLFTHFGK